MASVEVFRYVTSISLREGVEVLDLVLHYRRSLCIV
jgi:hypothetical protein